jgi:hypothetical protein
MRYVLGFTDAAAADQPDVIQMAGIGVVTSPAADASTPRDRLALQVRRASRLSSFLPIAPRHAVDEAGLAEWLPSRSAAIARRLEDVRDYAQITVEIARMAQPVHGGGDTWLRHRADGLRARRRVLDDLVEVCRGATAVNVEFGAGHRRFHAMCRRTGIDALFGMLAIGAPTLSPRASILATGPWPVFAFVGDVLRHDS